MGCTAPNPAFDETGGATMAGTDETGAETSEPVTTAPADSTTTEATSGEVGSESGVGSCDDPAPGVPVVVRPSDVSDEALCGYQAARGGLLELSAGTYRLHASSDCLVGEPVPIVFLPKGPSFSEGTQLCVTMDIRYREDCSFDAVTVREKGSGALVFAAGTSAMSHVVELELGLGDPAGPVCDCELASCCEGSPAPGLYTVDVSTEAGSDTLGQGEQTTFGDGDAMYELAVTRALATDDCERPVLVDWYYRHLQGG